MILPLVAFLFVVLISAGKTFHLAIGELLRRNDAIMESWLSWESSHSTDGSLRSCIEKIDFKGAFDVPKGICEN